MKTGPDWQSPMGASCGDLVQRHVDDRAYQIRRAINAMIVQPVGHHITAAGAADVDGHSRLGEGGKAPSIS
jgi:hypothetical protein